MRLLFLGNSHTYYNDMPFLAAELLRAGGDAVEVAMLTRGGQSLAGHLQNEQTRFNLLYGGWEPLPCAGGDQRIPAPGGLPARRRGG